MPGILINDVLIEEFATSSSTILEEIGQLQWSYEVAVQMLSHFEDTSRQSLLEKTVLRDDCGVKNPGESKKLLEQGLYH
jgi:hypothetical protein